VFNAGAQVAAGDYTGDTSASWQLSAGVSLPIFDGDYTRAREDSSRAALRIAEENLRQTTLALGAEVESAYLSAREAKARISAAEDAVRAATVSQEAARGKYLAEVGTVIDVTDAELRLRQSEADYVQALFDYSGAVAALMAAVGKPILTAGE
jgi:outer membrane protein TolC